MSPNNRVTRPVVNQGDVASPSGSDIVAQVGNVERILDGFADITV